MAGAKYSPGFDDPRAQRRRGLHRVLRLVGTVLGAVALLLTFAAYLNPSFAVEFGSLMALCADWIGLSR